MDTQTHTHTGTHTHIPRQPLWSWTTGQNPRVVKARQSNRARIATVHVWLRDNLSTIGNVFMIMIIVVVVVVVVMLVLAVISHSMHVGSCRTCCPRCSLFRQVLLQQLKHTGCSSAVSLQQLFKQR